MYIIVKLSNTGTHCRIPHFRHQYCFLLPPQSRISGLASSPLPLQECVASGGPGVGGGVDHTLIITAGTQQEASSSSSPSPARCGGCCRRCDWRCTPRHPAYTSPRSWMNFSQLVTHRPSPPHHHRPGVEDAMHIVTVLITSSPQYSRSCHTVTDTDERQDGAGIVLHTFWHNSSQHWLCNGKWNGYGNHCYWL